MGINNLISSRMSIITLASCLIIAACTAKPQYTGEVAHRNVNVISMLTEEVLPNRTVIVAGGKIVAIKSTNARDRNNAKTIIDGDGGYLIPGPTDMHTHLGLILPWDGEPSTAGISPYDTLKAATVNPARWAGREGEEGIIAIGARANMLLLAANPLEDIRATRNVKGVMLKGKWISRDNLDDMLRRRLGAGESPTPLLPLR